MTKREFDIVLWGATGATGRRTAHHLARRCRECGLALAIGGRNQKKLEAVRDDLPDAGSSIAILVGDSHDTAFLDAVTARAHVVVSTVALYGSALVAACVANATHYCDLTAEPKWRRAMIDAHETKARITGQGDSGGRPTALMLTEAALCLAEDADMITVGGGFWTPAAAMGKLLRDRITTHAGLTFELVDDMQA